MKAIQGVLARKSSVLHLFLVLTGIRRHELLRTWNRADACVRLALRLQQATQFVRPMTLLLTGAVARWMWNRGVLQTVTTWSLISTNCIISTTVIIYNYIQYFCFLFTKIFVFVSMMLVSSDFLKIPARLKIRVDLSPQRSSWNLPQSVRRILGKPGHFTISFWKDCDDCDDCDNCDRVLMLWRSLKDSCQIAIRSSLGHY